LLQKRNQQHQLLHLSGVEMTFQYFCKWRQFSVFSFKSFCCRFFTS
jgi:hypothetical protein